MYALFGKRRLLVRPLVTRAHALNLFETQSLRPRKEMRQKLSSYLRPKQEKKAPQKKKEHRLYHLNRRDGGIY